VRLNSVELNWIFYEPGAVMPSGQLYQEVIWRERTFVVTKKTGGLIREGEAISRGLRQHPRELEPGDTQGGNRRY